MRWTAASASAGGSVVLDGIAAGMPPCQTSWPRSAAQCAAYCHIRGFQMVGKTSELATLATLLQPVM
jgi:hypothetical protein